MRVLSMLGLAAVITTSVYNEPVSAFQKQEPIQFEQQELKLDHDVNGSVLALSMQTADQMNLVVKGQNEDGQKIFSIYGLNDSGKLSPTPAHQITMPEDALFYDFGAVFEKDIQVLLFLNHEGVQYYDVSDKSIKPLVMSPSIYLKGENPQLQSLDFARDVSGDEVADILIPGFDGYRLFTLNQVGGFREQLLNMQVEMRIGGANPRFAGGSAPRFSRFPSYSFDINFDGRDDLVFLKDQDFISFFQKEDGTFEEDATNIPLGLRVTGNSWVEQIKANERYADQTNLVETSIHVIEDLNGDDIVDIMTETDNAAGVFNRRTSYSIHPGRNDGGKLAFDAEPTSTFEVKGLRYQTRHVDLDNDGNTDFGAASVKIGIGKIIGALISGSTDATLSFFKHGSDGRFSEKPIYTKGVPVKFNLSSGNTSIPFVELADVTGDGLEDLLLNDKQKGIKIYRGQNEKRVFARKAEKIAVEMPASGNRINVVDLNGDDESDLIIHFDRLGSDGLENRNRVIIMMSK
ncbi:FG-GAP-like repeat-containing protein [Kordiimonas sp. SCSIO 12610]|uniref:FG-GAP-like repeat-containing protein n=1 Tax=Kordiimonas sp. SCSIO 12610 TaxID=2829597 RepID=UPI00210A9E1E|nr:FG-GAP-like repeat-containing protein [Kordiimonas sp. SCSIO 12610]UTW55991.1 VCBS repeat-containing protein [Kordiimonas sp. SCSIO 12610]